MQRFLLVYLLIMVTVATDAQQLSKQNEQFVDSVMTAYYKPDLPGAVVLIAKEGQPIYRKAYGLANLELNVMNKSEYLFAIGSMSKQFTAVCILKLVQEGKINLQDDVVKYLPDYNMHGVHITIENLLSHTSGIINPFDVKGVLAKAMLDESPKEIMNLFADEPLHFKPGTDWSYSNSNYLLAGLIIEKVSGMPLSAYLQQNIFTPLEMSHTYIGNHDSALFNSVTGYEFASQGKFKPTYVSWSWTYGAGQIVTNVDDLLKWDNALYTEKLLKKEWLQKAWQPFVLPNGLTTNYGFAFTINNLNGTEFIEHSGGINGFNCDGIRIPSQQLYVAIVSNNTTVWSSTVATAIAVQLSGQTLPKSLLDVMNEKTLKDYTGVYALQHTGGYTAFDSAGGQIYRYFVTKEDTLYEKLPGGTLYQLMHVGKDLFTPAWGIPYYQFHRNKMSGIASVEIYNAPIQYGPHEWKVKTDLPLPKEKQSITLTANQLESIKGKYDFGGGIIVPVTIEGSKIYLQQPAQDKDEIFAETETQFFSKKDFTLEFIKVGGKVTGMIIHVGATYEGKKIE
jgi:CubicO group peptidase (beta-lactamase class C family)